MSEIQIIQYRGYYYHLPKLPDIEHLAEEQISQIKWLLVQSWHNHLVTTRSSSKSANHDLILKWTDIKQDTRKILLSSVYKTVFAVAPGCTTHRRRHYVEHV